MFLIDNLLLSPFHGLLWVAREIQEAARQQRADERDGLTMALRELHLQLENGAIGEPAFEAAEQELLDRLDALDPPDADTDTQTDADTEETPHEHEH